MSIRKFAAIFLTNTLLLLAACSSAPSTSTTPEITTASPTATAAVQSTPTTTEPPPTPATPTETQTLPTPAPPEAGVIRLYYYGHVLTQGVDPAMLSGPHNIYSATSNDGINFTEDPGVRFSYDTGTDFGITDPDVVKMNDGSWLMFVSMGQSLFKGASATSSGPFIRDANFIWDQGGVPGSYNFSGTIRTFVTHGNEIHAAVYNVATGKLQDAGAALNTPAVGTVGSPSIIKIDDTYYMVYLYCPYAGAEPRQHEIYMATSRDGITWSQHAQNKFVCKGSVPGAVYYNNIIYIYYGGTPAQPGEQGGMRVAVSTDKGLNFNHFQVNITGTTLSGAVDPAPIVDSR